MLHCRNIYTLAEQQAISQIYVFSYARPTIEKVKAVQFEESKSSRITTL